jgi:hypothetical protein
VKIKDSRMKNRGRIESRGYTEGNIEYYGRLLDFRRERALNNEINIK